MAVAVCALILTGLVKPGELQKRYPPAADPYWFELNNDLLFSEEIHIEPYNEAQLGKLEYPALAIDGHDNVYVAYDYTDTEGREAIFLSMFEGSKLQHDKVVGTERRYLALRNPPEWRQPLQISAAAGTEYRPRLAVTPENDIWIAWSARRNEQWDVFVRVLSQGQLNKELNLTDDIGYDFRPAIFCDSHGRVWIAWERATPDKQIHIFARYFLNGAWSDTYVIEGRDGYAYRPTMREAADGSVWFAWDHTQGANTDIFIRRFRKDGLEQPVRVSSHPAIDSKAALAWYGNKLWIAWTTNRREDNHWGIIRYPVVRAYDGKRWFEPISPAPGIDLKDRSETQSYEYPNLTFDSSGRLYLFTRHDHVFNAAYYEQDAWHDNWLLDEQGWGIRGLYVHTAWNSNGELWLARRDRRTIFLQQMVRTTSDKREPLLRKFEHPSYPDSLKSVEEQGFRGPDNKKYRVFYGDLHVHTAYSDGSGSFDELFNLYRNVYKLDFLAITDHDALRLGYNHFSPAEWAYLKALNEIYNQPGEFVTLNGYEWTHSTWSGRQDSSVQIGHKNVYFKGGEDSPFFNHHDSVAYDARTLFETLHQHEALAFPHHPPWGGITWQDHDPGIETNYEIVSIHGANEYPGNLPIPHRGGMPGTFAQDGLARGEVFGFVGASDSHGLYHHSHEGWREDAYKGGWTGVLLDTTLSRESVWSALKQRRNYATAGEKYYLDFTINGQPMGSRIITVELPVISCNVRSNDMLYAYVIRNNDELFVTGNVGGSRTFFRGLRDDTIPPGENFYYLRVRYNDGTLAWSSPIWVTYAPATE